MSTALDVLALTEKLLRRERNPVLRVPLEFGLALDRPRQVTRLLRLAEERYGRGYVLRDEEGERWMMPCPACRAWESDPLHMWLPLSVYDDDDVECAACGAGLVEVLRSPRERGREPRECEVCSSTSEVRRHRRRRRGGGERWIELCATCSRKERDEGRRPR